MFRKKDISTLTDEELLQQYKVSEQSDYFGELYNRYIPLLYGICLKYLNNTDKAQDAVMQLFENLLPKVSNYEIVLFRTWIYSVAKNHCLEIIRKESKEIVVDFEASLMESDPIVHLFSDEEEGGEKLEALKHCMQKLSDQQRVSITGFFIEELSYADIAEQTGYTLSRVKSYIQNGKRNLKACIEKRVK